MFKQFYFILIIIIFYANTKRLVNKQKKIINIVYAINNNYINYIYTSLYTLFENSDMHTNYNIYIQIGKGFNKTNINLILSLEKIYFNCAFHFLDMGNDFSSAIKGKLDHSTYYRLKLPILLTHVNRIIHIDSDSIILKDLTELFTLNFEGKYILGRLDMITDELDKLGVYTNTYINCGIILIDLYNLRKYNYTDKFIDYISNHNNYRYLNHHDQTCINYVCYDKIGLLRPKFHMWPFIDKEEIIKFNKGLRTKYNEKEFLKDYDDPFIVHFPGHFKIKKEYFNTKYFNLYNSYKDKANTLRKTTKM